ncbi:hypothetical protein [Fusobacterium sp. MFO224]|uniref:hypothetical protein n=1 Tax=Fusobacterium sp. MFO224 TaxID=3378070 RepID=UPI0038525E49
MKSFIIGIIFTLSVFGINKYYLSKIEKLEDQIRFEKKQVEICRKQLRKKMAEYYNKANFKKIELEMLNKENMEHSKEIIYFKLEGKEKNAEEN